MPDVSWLKDGAPVANHVTITNSHKGSQMLIPTSERTDTGIYTIMVKNMVGQETFNIEIRVTGRYGVTVILNLQKCFSNVYVPQSRSPLVSRFTVRGSRVVLAAGCVKNVDLATFADNLFCHLIVYTFILSKCEQSCSKPFCGSDAFFTYVECLLLMSVYFCLLHFAVQMTPNHQALWNWSRTFRAQ